MVYLVQFPSGDYLTGPDMVPAGYISIDEAEQAADLFGGTVFPVRVVMAGAGK